MTRYRSATQARREKMVFQIEGGIKLLFWLLVLCIASIPVNLIIDACKAVLGW